MPGARGVFRHPRDEDLGIGLGVDSWRPEMMTTHEIGHFIAWSGLPGDGYDFKAATAPEALTKVMRAIWASKAFASLRRLPKDARREMMPPPEVFARAYAQWIAWRSGDKGMLDQVDRALASSVPRRNLLQWRYADFLPIAEALDTLFEGMGWLAKR